MAAQKVYDLGIFGGGVTGASTLFVSPTYSTISSIAFLEKYGSVAQVNSHPRNNSQTVHFGDIETNIPLDKAILQRQAGIAIKRYVERKGLAGDLFRKTHKMVLAVGKAEIAALWARYEEFKPYFPNIRWAGKDEIAALEPNVVAGRDPREAIAALVSDDGYAVNYQRLSECFLEDALATKKDIDLSFNTEVHAIRRRKDGIYELETNRGIYCAKVVIAACGPYSLLFAQDLGYGMEFGILPVAGSFYFARRTLNGKVYRVQDPDIPFAAHHGDPNVTDAEETRFGPTAKVLPMLERRNFKTTFDFMRTPIVSVAGLLSLKRISSNGKLFRFMLKNLCYDLPFLGKYLFLQSVRKIVPSLTYGDLTYGRNLGGIRPQIVNLETRTLLHGEATIKGDNAIFVTTPSPGASNCLQNAERFTRQAVEFLGEGYRFDQARFDADFKE